MRTYHCWVYIIAFWGSVVLGGECMAGTSVSMASLGWQRDDSLVSKSVYPPDTRNKSAVYDWLWGKHYRFLYTVPVTVPAIKLTNFRGGMTVVGQAKNFQGLLLEDKQNRRFLLKLLGGATTFLESSFFQEIYNKTDFQHTYLDEFIGDAYTIINPYTFISADFMARQVGLSSNHSHIYYLLPGLYRDTVGDGSSIRNKLICVIDLPGVDVKKNILTTDSLLQKIEETKSNQVDQDLYIRQRLLDMLTGDWNKIPENWNWQASPNEDRIRYTPIVIDRNHAFTKVDGVMFKQMLKMLGLSFIVNYDGKFNDIKEINTLGYALDMALTGPSDASVWNRQARYLKINLTDQLIDSAFNSLPTGVANEETNQIKMKLKQRRQQLEPVAQRYFNQLQRNSVITGTDRSDHIRIDRHNPDSIHVRIYDREKNELVFDRNYSRKYTREIWLYGLEGDDLYEVDGHAKNELPVYLISGKGNNRYNLHPGHHIRIYGYPSEKKILDTVRQARKILLDDSVIHAYDYKKIKYHHGSFTPWGIYDSDNGISLGTYFTYTQYGFKRSPFTYQHRIGYNYVKGFMYQGIFPSYNGRKTFYLDAQISSARNFYNFFGYGNNTEGYKEEKKNYNRVNIREFSVNPSLHLNLSPNETLIFYSAVELFKAKQSDDRFINQYYPGDSGIFKANYYADLGVTFQIDRNPSAFISRIEGVISSGWKIGLRDASRNFPYAEASLALDMEFTDRLTLATLMKGEAIFNNKYEFYQSATTELRGYRDNRFIGKQSFYQYSDLRFDMGKLKNPFTPLKYGLFVGFDYGRVWFPGEDSKKWHTSYGGGIWLTIINKFTTKYSCFGSTDSFRFMFELGLGF